MKELRKLASDAIEGNVDALEAYIQLTNAKKELELIIKEVIEHAIDEFDKHDQKTLDFKGFEIRKTQSARYDFKHISVWNSVKDNLKKIEDYAKLAQKQGDSIILETGEVIEPAIKNYSEFGLAIKKK